MSLLALQDLFRRYRDRATGVWRLGQEPSRTIFFDYGDAVFATSTHLPDRLTSILVERGRITQAQMDYALANLKPGISIGKNLIDMGFITQRDLLDVAKLQVERIIHGAMAQPDQLPVFEAKELDTQVVRLPLSTPQLLLGGILAIQDREALLELLGPLNQVVVLQGRSVMDLALPADLGRLTALLDGTHTLLELSREVGAEPMRVGAFALFLREMGWARLHEMPPLDRQALDLALAPEPEPLSAPLPEPAPDASPSLFATIQEAARPTTNLEHLSQALDEVPPPAAEPLPEAAPGPAPEPVPEPPAEPLYLPENLQVPGLTDADATIRVVSGQAQVPTPSVELPPLPEQAEAEPRVTLKVPLEPAEDLPATPPPAELEPPSPLPVKAIGITILVVGLATAGVLWMRRRARRPRPKPAPPVVVPAPPAPMPTGPSIAVPPAPEPAQPDASQPEPAAPAKPEPAVPAKAEPPAPKRAEKPAPASAGDRLEALRRGDLARAVAQGAQRVEAARDEHWTLRLEIACQGDTIRRVAELFRDGKPDLFLLPMTLRDGRGCYQVMYGEFPSKEAAEKEVRKLPSAFTADRNRPKPFRFREIPKHQ